MRRRKGAGKGTGKGYRNLKGFPKDPMVHGDSAKGKKQAQKVINFDWSNLSSVNKAQRMKNRLENKGYIQVSTKQKGTDKWQLRFEKDSDSDGVPDYRDCEPHNPDKQDKLFEVAKGINIKARYEPTRYGFRHVAVLYVNGQEVGRAKVSYQNRTWESYEFESVVNRLLDSTDAVSETQKKKFLDRQSGREKAEVESRLRTVANVAQLGEIMTDNKKEANVWKKRMLKAGLPGLDIPEDWDNLSEDEKEKRLNKVIALAKGEK